MFMRKNSSVSKSSYEMQLLDQAQPASHDPAFEGRDAAGKWERSNGYHRTDKPRLPKLFALGTPSDQQKTQWYFPAHVEEFPFSR